MPRRSRRRLGVELKLRSSSGSSDSRASSPANLSAPNLRDKQVAHHRRCSLGRRRRAAEGVLPTGEARRAGIRCDYRRGPGLTVIRFGRVSRQTAETGTKTPSPGRAPAEVLAYLPTNRSRQNGRDPPRSRNLTVSFERAVRWCVLTVALADRRRRRVAGVGSGPTTRLRPSCRRGDARPPTSSRAHGQRAARSRLKFDLDQTPDAGSPVLPKQDDDSAASGLSAGEDDPRTL